MKNILSTSILFATTALGLSACGPVVPSNPTWEHDIRPLMVARCIRCHDGTGKVDPATSSAVQKLPSAGFNFDYTTYDEGKAAGLGILVLLGPKSVRGPMGAIPIMPPPPAETLEDWEIQMLTNWAASPR